MAKVGLNHSCPCGSGLKFKHCCFGKVDWDQLLRSKVDVRPFLSVRGRNLHFVDSLLGILELGKPCEAKSRKDYKKAFTAARVRAIHEAVMEAWPPDMDIASALRKTSSDVSGLYIGDYEPQFILDGIVRHSIYANKLLVIDPFLYPVSVRDEYNPLLHPEQYRGHTLKCTNFWLSLVPWIDAGIVEVIRTPGDFDRQLNGDALIEQLRKFESSVELQEAGRQSERDLMQRHGSVLTLRHQILTAPDSYLREVFPQIAPDDPGITADEFLAYIQRLRDTDPYFLEPLDRDGATGQLNILSTGSSYTLAKITASLTGSYLVTDLHVKWREIELDREGHAAAIAGWSPFAKALQNTTLRYLNSVNLKQALALRKEGRLESFRSFLHRVWIQACSGNPYEEANAVALGEELSGQVATAEQEWERIDQDLLKMVGNEARVALLAAGPLIAAGHAGFLAAASIVAGGISLATSYYQRRSFPDKFPAAFFLEISR